jgi:uncharacterized protein YjbI with pentapeptide repeats
MAAIYVSEIRYERDDFNVDSLPCGDYEACTFSACTFVEMDLSRYRFVDCTFINCHLSVVKLQDTVLSQVSFEGCKMLGLHFEDCHPFGLSVDATDCQMDYCTFYKVVLKKRRFSGCQFREADFTGADLSNSVFTACDFTLARFDGTTLERCDFRLSRGYSIDPSSNKIKKARFSLSGVVGLLDAFGITVENE